MHKDIQAEIIRNHTSRKNIKRKERDIARANVATEDREHDIEAATDRKDTDERRDIAGRIEDITDQIATAHRVEITPRAAIQPADTESRPFIAVTETQLT